MDPNATLSQLLDALAAGDRETAAIAALNLGDWLDNGGFMPDPVGEFPFPTDLAMLREQGGF